MKDYTFEDDDKASYIMSVEKCKDGTYKVTFADGTVFINIEANHENLEKIMHAMEAQAKDAVSNYKVFSERCETARKSLFKVAGSLAVGSSIVSFMPTLSNYISRMGGTPIRVAGVGLITLLGSIPSVVNLDRECSRIKELNKIRFRNRNYEELRDFRRYENSLAGLDSFTARRIASSNCPFSIINIDNFTIDDLKQIISNIEVEKKYVFSTKRRAK